jgi:hypothetical protein
MRSIFIGPDKTKNHWACFEFDIDYEPITSDKVGDWITSTMVSWSGSLNG